MDRDMGPILAELEQLREERDDYRQTLEKYGDMIVVDSESIPHDVGMLAREVLSRGIKI